MVTTRHAGKVCPRCSGNLIHDSYLDEYNCLQCGHVPEWSSKFYSHTTTSEQIRMSDNFHPIAKPQRKPKPRYTPVSTPKHMSASNPNTGEWSIELTHGRAARPPRLRCVVKGCGKGQQGRPGYAQGGSVICRIHRAEYIKTHPGIKPPIWRDVAPPRYRSTLTVEYAMLRVQSQTYGPQTQAQVLRVTIEGGIPKKYLRQHSGDIAKQFGKETGMRLIGIVPALREGGYYAKH